MKKIVFTAALMLSAGLLFAQSNLISYDDIRFMLHNTLPKNDEFLVSKGYVPVAGKNSTKNKKYTLTLPGSTHNNIELRSDGKKIFIQIESNLLGQYDMIKNSIASFKIDASAGPDTEAFLVKNLGNIYIITSDSVPYDPLKKDYEIQIVPDKNIAAID